MGSVDQLASYLDGEADWYLSDLTGGAYLGSQASILVNYGRPYEACSVVGESVLTSVADLIELAIRGMQAMSRKCIHKVHMSPL